MAWYVYYSQNPHTITGYNISLQYLILFTYQKKVIQLALRNLHRVKYVDLKRLEAPTTVR